MDETASRRQDASPAGPGPLRVLVVDDNPGDVRLVAEMLRDLDPAAYRLDAVGGLAPALDRVGRGGVDVVLLDLDLPDSVGLETLARLQAGAPDVPVVVLTGLDDQRVAVEAVGRGARDYLVKGDLRPAPLAWTLEHARAREAASAAAFAGAEGVAGPGAAPGAAAGGDLEFLPVLTLPALRVVGLEARVRGRGALGSADGGPRGGRASDAQAAWDAELLRVAAVCRHARGWGAARGSGEPPFVYVSPPAGWCCSPSRAGDLVAAARGAGLDASRFAVGLDARSVAEGWRAALPSLEVLASAGVSRVLEGFPDAGLPLHALADLPLTGLRLSGPLLGQAAGCGRQRAVLEAVVGMARGLGLACWAGDLPVGTALPPLVEAGVRRASGTGVCPAVDASRVPALLKRRYVAGSPT